MTTAAVFLVLVAMVLLGALAIVLAMGAGRIDRVELPDREADEMGAVELPDDADPIDADRHDLPYGGGWS